LTGGADFPASGSPTIYIRRHAQQIRADGSLSLPFGTAGVHTGTDSSGASEWNAFASEPELQLALTLSPMKALLGMIGLPRAPHLECVGTPSCAATGATAVSGFPETRNRERGSPLPPWSGDSSPGSPTIVEPQTGFGGAPISGADTIHGCANKLWQKVRQSLCESKSRELMRGGRCTGPEDYGCASRSEIAATRAGVVYWPS
jgi:hypothetical protein